ncbi:prepilin-type N-terminal cleavage/methylation domain-containing protein [Alkalimonas sp. NCh-2]|uniref:PilW family protein n=1 Tax=Alkalimonas sp. NCh-2 TaxID=3144846 RepID=UPI0031F6EF5C
MTTGEKSHGFTLVELMIALVLGLVLLAGVIGVFLSNQATSRVNHELATLQSSARLAFQMMSQDIRSAGFAGCNNSGRVVSIITGTPDWSQWRGGIEGFAAGVHGDSESLRLMYGAGDTVSVLNHVPPTLTVNNSSALRVGDIAMLCDDTLSSVFQVSARSDTSINHAAAAPLNCATDLGFEFPFVCSSARPRIFPGGSMLMRFESVLWLVAPSTDNPDINSLYREVVVGGSLVREEVLFGVANVSFAYQEGDLPFGPVAFSPALNMGNVVGVQVELLMDPSAFVAADVPIDMRTIRFFASIRNRLR